MSNFTVCFNAVLPLIIYVAIGVGIRKAGLINGPEVKRFNRLMFAAFFPVMMFDNIYESDLGSVFDVKMIVFSVLFIVISAAVSCLAVLKLTDEQKVRGAMAQAIYRGNFVLLGLVIINNIFGKSALEMTTATIVVVVPVINVAAVVVLEIFRGGTPDIPDMIKNIAKNPIILGSLCGIAFCLLGIDVPDPLKTVISGMSASVTPVALVLLGAALEVDAVEARKRELAMCVIGKLFVWPAIGLTTAYLLGFTGPQFVLILVLTAAPTAVSSYTMAEAMDSDGELAAGAVMITTFFSCVTLFLWLYLFRCLGAY